MYFGPGSDFANAPYYAQTTVNPNQQTQPQAATASLTVGATVPQKLVGIVGISCLGLVGLRLAGYRFNVGVSG